VVQDAAVTIGCRARIIQRIIHANHDIQHRCFLDRCRDNHALRPAIEMPAQGCFGQEFAAAFQHQINAKSPQGIAAGVACSVKANALVTNAQRIRCLPPR
jgi:hypothetical protein